VRETRSWIATSRSRSCPTRSLITAFDLWPLGVPGCDPNVQQWQRRGSHVTLRSCRRGVVFYTPGRSRRMVASHACQVFRGGEDWARQRRKCLQVRDLQNGGEGGIRFEPNGTI
jgi:hypothetical protein